MLLRSLFFWGLTLVVTTTLGSAQSQSPNGVKTLNPPGAISTGRDTWSVGARAGEFIFVAGMQGVDPATNKLVEGAEARIRQAFLNLKLIAESEGATLQDMRKAAFRAYRRCNNRNRLRRSSAGLSHTKGRRLGRT